MTMVTVTTFTSLTSAQVSAASVHRRYVAFYNRGAGDAAILIGDGTASAANCTRLLRANEFWEVPESITERIAAIMLSAGNLQVTIIHR